jgi:hypothetical protein
MALLTLSTARRALLLGILFSGICPAQVFNEYHVKAVFLYSFAKFVEWPPLAFSSPAATMTICILGDDPFGSFLDNAVRGKTAGDRPLAVHRVTDLRGTGECQILFIAASERNRMPILLASVTNPGLLTVGDTAEFTAQGGVIGLQRDGDRIRLLVNLPAAEKAKLRISSRVLSLATLIR